MGRTLTALAAAAGLLQLDAATAFQLPLGARSRATRPVQRERVNVTPFSARPRSEGALRMTVAPEGLDSLGKAKDPTEAAATPGGKEASPAAAGEEEEKQDVSSSGAAAAPKPEAPPEPEVVDCGSLYFFFPISFPV
ncbi:unnamed protein product, partial [Ectocarpus sp. 12 AP-2014]